MTESPATVKKAMLALNQPGSGVCPIEEAWVIRSLIHDDHRSQIEVAEAASAAADRYSPRASAY